MTARAGMALPIVTLAASLAVTLGGGAVTAASAVGTHHVFRPEGPAARSIAAHGTFLFVVCGIVYALVLMALALAIWRRRPDGDDGPDTERRLSRVIAAAVAASVLTLVVLVVSSVLAGRGLTSPSGAGAVVIDVIGHQWWWEFQYRDVSPSEFVTSPNELHIPVGVPVVLKVQSRDVIHSFWVPALHGKRDLIPGQITHMWLQADRPGVFRGQCAEFCGTQHAKMAFVVVAEPMADFKAWLAWQRRPAPTPAAADQRQGQQVFLTSTCATCHAVRGSSAASRVGPELTHVASRATLAAGTLPNTMEHLARWVRDPQAIKPGSRMPAAGLSEADFKALLAYLRSLR
jgi:cytochrome c oxidase subunit 2